MITDAVVSLVASFLGLLGAALPVDSLDLPSGSSIASAIGTYAGPFDRFLPLSEAATFLHLVFSVWLPIALAYSVAKWVYRHLPVFGKG